MSFGLPLRPDEPLLTYGGYLKINELLSLQHLLSDPLQHDETLFIIIHQVYELWFKQLLHELDTIAELLQKDEPLSVHRLLRRCIEIQRVLISQISILETMTPMDFLAFRDHLNPASGFQSAQFRELEYLAGLKNRSYLRNYREDSPEYARLLRRLEEPTLGDHFYNLLRRRGFDLPFDEEGKESASRRIKSLMRIYEESNRHFDLYLLIETMLEFDENFALWRMRHVKMVERMIGSKTGTGGSEGAAYLQKTVEKKFFPEFWEMRTYLSNQAPGYDVK